MMRASRGAVFASLVVAMLIAWAGAADAFEGDGYLVRASFGLFIPGSDYQPVGGEDWEAGPDFGITFGKNFIDTLGFEIGMHGYSAEAGAGGSSVEINSVGLEALITVQPAAEKFQPFAGIGIGFYSTTLTSRSSGATTETEYDGAGAVIKAGVRYQASERVHAGGFVRAFGNNSKSDEGGDEVDLGGASVNLEVSLAL